MGGCHLTHLAGFLLKFDKAEINMENQKLELS